MLQQQPQFNDLSLNNNNNKSCELMDGFAIFIQLSLCFTALLTLFYKRSTESPQRPVQIWALDVSKQFVGAGMIHCINICISYAASKPEHGPVTNLCTWYFLNVAIDTTLGVLLLWCWFTLISITLDVFNLGDQYQTGEYGPPPLTRRLIPWIRQMSLFLIAEVLAKICLYIFLVNSPWLFWLGEYAINWINDDKSQVVFVMLIFPVIMNAIQFWLTDTILKVHEFSITKSKESSNKLPFHQPQTKTKKNDSSYFSTPLFAVFIEQTERTPLIFPPSKHRMSS